MRPWWSVASIACAACGRIDFDVTEPVPALSVCRSPMVVGKSGGQGQGTALASIGPQRAVAWQDVRDDGTFAATLSLVDASGAVTDVVLPCMSQPYTFPPFPTALAASGAVYAVVWADASATEHARLQLAIVGTDGTLRSGPTPVDTGFVGYPSLVWTGNAFAVAYGLNANDPPTTTSSSHIELRLFSEDGVALGPPAQLSDDNSRVSYPTLVWTGTGYLATWRDGRNNGADAYLGAADANGVKRGPDTFLGPTRAGVGLGWNGSMALAAYGDPDNILQLSAHDPKGARVTTLRTPSALYEPAAAWDGDEWLVVALENGTHAPEVQPIGSDLRPLGAPVSVWSGAVRALPRVAWEDDRAVIVFADYYSYPEDVYLTELCRDVGP